jgi:hypothetical protein
MQDTQDILNRFIEGYFKSIDTPEPWVPHVLSCHNELVQVDSLYTVYQIKEKFGSLRYYFAPSNPKFHDKMQEIVQRYEKDSMDWNWGNY